MLPFPLVQEKKCILLFVSGRSATLTISQVLSFISKYARIKQTGNFKSFSAWLQIAGDNNGFSANRFADIVVLFITINVFMRSKWSNWVHPRQD